MGDNLDSKASPPTRRRSDRPGLIPPKDIAPVSGDENRTATTQTLDLLGLGHYKSDAKGVEVEVVFPKKAVVNDDGDQPPTE
ncbi:MAG: hypothetical protein NT003_03460 [Candidatus Magasanikbacteria bacterium]|nr:hypothetical protein [Candidatus Magasanikbacteria bacterium]